MRRNMMMLAALGLMVGGCYHYEPIQVTVRDAATHTPASGVHIEAYYPTHTDFSDPKTTTAVTNRDGKASIMVAVNQPSDQVCLYFRALYLDDPVPQGVLILPVSPYLESTLKSSKATSRPAPLVVEVLTPEEYHKKYPTSGSIPGL